MTIMNRGGTPKIIVKTMFLSVMKDSIQKRNIDALTEARSEWLHKKKECFLVETPHLPMAEEVLLKAWTNKNTE